MKTTCGFYSSFNSQPLPPLVGEGGDGGIDRLSKTNARQLRKNPTDSEKRLWMELRLRQMEYKFRRQFTIGKYIVDFACPERKLIVELDGGHHAEQMDYDAGRTRWLESQGFRVLRFWNNEIQTNLNGVKEVIYRHLKEANPPPPSSPTRGEEVNSQPLPPLVGEGGDGGVGCA